MMYTIRYTAKSNLQRFGEDTWWNRMSFLADDVAEAQKQADDLNNQSDYYTYEVEELES